MYWCQKYFLKNKKNYFDAFPSEKALWKTTATTLPNMLALDNQSVLLNVIRTNVMVPIPSKSYTKEFYLLNTFILS